MSNTLPPWSIVIDFTPDNQPGFISFWGVLFLLDLVNSYDGFISAPVGVNKKTESPHSYWRGLSFEYTRAATKLLHWVWCTFNQLAAFLFALRLTARREDGFDLTTWLIFGVGRHNKVCTVDCTWWTEEQNEKYHSLRERRNNTQNSTKSVFIVNLLSGPLTWNLCLTVQSVFGQVFALDQPENSSGIRGVWARIIELEPVLAK